MNADHVRSFLKQNPFKPFTIKTAGGDSYKVTHVEAVFVPPNGDAVVLWPSEGGFTVVDMGQITEAAYPARKSK